MATKASKVTTGNVQSSEIKFTKDDEIETVRPEELTETGKPKEQITFSYVAKFKKVSFDQFKKDLIDCGFNMNDAFIRSVYDAIKLPTRATMGSAGYDFYSPIPFIISNMNVSPRGITVPTGIRCALNPFYFMMMVPRSGLGIKEYTRLGNSVGIIDRDYYFADNEGDIMINIRSDVPGNPPVYVSAGQAICQGIILPFGIADGDDAKSERTGGLGSTDR